MQRKGGRARWRRGGDASRPRPGAWRDGRSQRRRVRPGCVASLPLPLKDHRDIVQGCRCCPQTRSSCTTRSAAGASNFLVIASRAYAFLQLHPLTSCSFGQTFHRPTAIPLDIRLLSKHCGAPIFFNREPVHRETNPSPFLDALTSNSRRRYSFREFFRSTAPCDRLPCRRVAG